VEADVTTIFLTGCMGAGKSTVGRALAARLGRAFIDLDEEIAGATGLRPGEIIEGRGEPAFREIESAALLRLAEPDGRVVALGGGTLERPENLALVRRTGKLVYLRASAEVLAARAEGEGLASRPLLQGAALERMREILARREAIYGQADLTVTTEGRGPEEIARELAGPFDEPHPLEGTLDRVDVALGGASYPIYLASGERWRLGRLVAAHAQARRAMLVADASVASRFGWEAEASLRAAGFEVASVTVPSGEASKSLEGLSRLWDELLGAGLDRASPVVALGGGVVGDLAGFAAATLFRGVPLVQVPTTLLAQVDSSVGGKTGINHPLGKNLLGAFHQPRLVLIDTSYLGTLPPRDRRAGLAEIVKYGVIADAAFFAALERDAESLASGAPAALRPAIRRCCEIKAAVVASDERETSGARAVLNFGHTLGHALEQVAGYGALRHGEAVAVGMVLAARISERLGLCPAGLPQRVAALLVRLGLPTSFPFVPETLVDAAKTDKKVRSGAIHFIAVEALGRVRQVPLSPEALVEALRGLP
jgi:shikimate kinase/3-dehydroquinate synthase